MKIELLWFEDCPCHTLAEGMVKEILGELGIDEPIQRVRVETPERGDSVTFPGSPTIRINGVDVEPGWEPCPECTPRCRLYQTAEGIGCLPDKDWVAEAVRAAAKS